MAEDGGVRFHRKPFMSDEPKALRGWHYLPALPLRAAPLFRWPFKPVEALKWLIDGWLPISEKLVLVAIAFATLAWVQPPLEVTATLSPDWIIGIWLRNMVLMIAVAGGLHLYFYRWRKQGDELKFDARPLKTRGSQFKFGDQVKDNIFWTLASGVSIWTGYEVLMFWAMSNGWLPMLKWAENPILFVALFLLLPLWESFYFYWIHRLLHWPPLYKRIHILHHRNVNIGPWSGMSMHPLEHLLYFGTVLIHWVVPAHPVHIINHLQYSALTAATSHTGFDALQVKGRPRLHLGNFHHQMHHRYFECNYGSPAVPLDNIFGSFHDGTVEANERMAERRERMMV